MSNAEELLAFWLEDVGPRGWYIRNDDVDRKITERYGALWLEAQEEDHLGWTSTPRATLALLILLDQFPRNMFRGDGKSYATDKLARCVAKKAIEKGWDKRIDGPERQFFYLPLMHSECLTDQDRCVRLMRERMGVEGQSNILHARAHREVVRRFGRFPHRNVELGRNNTPAETAFLSAGGYAALVNDMEKQAA
ncbi:DUF924 family protein [Qingshengfaniella alkalisoli]|uniref:DUF924 domain-containing protein n=1 Tax=Qingshengfaniella alkalisoli TaxID=2599296 RepID=A0A5B8I651_9RHOB|nr:DUF924 family protein [Qingshengfaniella alkalisoli]QDY68885.1 DUF924 domain-containing protein [Qingshengfaniella alkalisoli]